MNIPKDTQKFTARWRLKYESLKIENLEDYFDCFFSCWVLYNHFYEVIASNGYGNSQEDKKNAVKMVTKLIGTEDLFKNEILQCEAEKIISLINSKQFYIRDHKWDEQRINKLNTQDACQWIKGLLEIVYAIRCNTFHGEKEFKNNQKEILLPCINIVKELNNLITTKLNDYD